MMRKPHLAKVSRLVKPTIRPSLTITSGALKSHGTPLDYFPHDICYDLTTSSDPIWLPKDTTELESDTPVIQSSGCCR